MIVRVWVAPLNLLRVHPATVDHRHDYPPEHDGGDQPLPIYALPAIERHRAVACTYHRHLPQFLSTRAARGSTWPLQLTDGIGVAHGLNHDAQKAARGGVKTLTRKRLAALVAFDLAAILVVAALVALAVWQVHRRAWKLDLIARVDARVQAAPATAPGRDQWAGISAAVDEHRRVTVTGTGSRTAAHSFRQSRTWAAGIGS